MPAIHTRQGNLNAPEEFSFFTASLDDMDVNDLARSFVQLARLSLRRSKDMNAKSRRVADCAARDVEEWRLELNAMEACGILLSRSKDAWEAKTNLLFEMHREIDRENEAKNESKKESK